MCAETDDGRGQYRKGSRTSRVSRTPMLSSADMVACAPEKGRSCLAVPEAGSIAERIGKGRFQPSEKADEEWYPCH